MRLETLDDNVLLNLYLYNVKNNIYTFNDIKWILYKNCKYCNDPYFGKHDNKGFCSKKCGNRFINDPEKIGWKIYKKEIYGIETDKKFCSTCKTIKSKDDFWKNKFMCKECCKAWGQSEKGKTVYKRYQQSEKGCKNYKRYRKSDKRKITSKRYTYSYTKWNSLFTEQIKPYEEIRQNGKFIEVKCAYCGRWFIPKNTEIKNRLNVINGIKDGDSRLYCSNNCKKECPTFNQTKYPKGYKKATSREVQPELRQLVLARDNYTCQKCEKTQEQLKVGLHCHHIEGVEINPVESADIDNCITLCKTCHKEIHKLPGCSYYDMRCIK